MHLMLCLALYGATCAELGVPLQNYARELVVTGRPAEAREMLESAAALPGVSDRVSGERAC